jgi:hypothetical protein
MELTCDAFFKHVVSTNNRSERLRVVVKKPTARAVTLKRGSRESARLRMGYGVGLRGVVQGSKGALDDKRAQGHS